MLKLFLLLGFLVLPAIAQARDAAAIPALGSLTEGFEERRSQALKPLADLEELYAENLEKLLADATKEGKLELVLATKNELEGFRRGTTPEANPALPELQRLQSIFRKSYQHRLATAKAARNAITADYREQLGILQVNLTKQENLDDAIRVKKVIDALDGGEAFTVLLGNGESLTVSADKLTAGDIALGKRGASGSSAGELNRPDGEEANLSKPVQVFILLGQSNMLGFGKIAGNNPGTLEHATRAEGLYPFLIDDEGRWTERKDVRNVRVMVDKGGMKVFNNEWMSITGKAIGPEIGIGHPVGSLLEEPVLILKSCIGNRSLGWDLLPPGSVRFEQGGKVYAGYKDSPDSWKKGTKPKPIGWYAGKQYDDDVANAKKVLANLATYYPGAREYEVAGFFWWQGAKDSGNAAHAARYEENLVRLIKQLRIDFDAPNSKFVCATLGQTKMGAGGNEGAILKGTLAVDGESGKYPEFEGNVASVYSNPHYHGGSANNHYGGNARTYLDIGLAMGAAMVELLRR